MMWVINGVVVGILHVTNELGNRVSENLISSHIFPDLRLVNFIIFDPITWKG